MSAGDWKDMLSAVQNGDLELVQYHIGKGINPNYQHPELLVTPLIESIEYGQVEIAKYLLENGADPDLRAGFSEETPLALAKKLKNKAMIELLKKYATPRKWGFF